MNYEVVTPGRSQSPTCRLREQEQRSPGNRMGSTDLGETTVQPLQPLTSRTSENSPLLPTSRINHRDKAHRQSRELQGNTDTLPQGSGRLPLQHQEN